MKEETIEEHKFIVHYSTAKGSGTYAVRAIDMESAKKKVRDPKTLISIVDCDTYEECLAERIVVENKETEMENE